MKRLIALLSLALLTPAAADPLADAATHARLYRAMSNPPPAPATLEPGHWVPALPRTAAALRVAGITYYGLDGLFYRPAERGFVVVETPAEAFLRRIPMGHAVVEVEGRRFYVVGEHFFVWSERQQGYLFTAPPNARIEEVTLRRMIYRARAEREEPTAAPEG